MENKTNDITQMVAHTGQNTLAHEQLARDEQFVGIFFAAFAIQYSSEQNDNTSLKDIKFLDMFKDIELYVSQRVFIKSIIHTKPYKPVCEELYKLIVDNEQRKGQNPYDYFLSKIDKSNKHFLIRQIFNHTDQVLEKYRFINDFVNKDVTKIDMEALYKKMWHFPVEQQILVCVYLFSKINDNFESEKKSIGISYNEKAVQLDTKDSYQKDEDFVGVFFSAFVIQYYLHKDFSNILINTVNFIIPHKNIELYASQRVFIKNLISNKKYKIICEEIKYLLIEYNTNKEKSPHEIFLSRINKEVQLRQVFAQGEAMLEKYRFLHDIEDKDITDIDMDELYKKIWHFSIEQQIIICIYLFSKIKDTHDSRKKTIGASFVENSTKIKSAFISLGKKGTDLKNFDLFINTFKA